MRSLDSKKRRKKLSSQTGFRKNTVNVDKYDLLRFNELKTLSKELLKKISAARKGYLPFNELLEDTYGFLYRYVPDLYPDWEINTKFLLNKALEKQISESAEYKKLRVNTRLDEISSMIGTEIFADELKKLLEDLQEQLKAHEELMKAQQALEEAAAGVEEGEDGDAGENGRGKDKPGKGANEMTLEKAKQELEKARANFDRSIKSPEFKAGVDQAVGKTLEESKGLKENIKAWGLGDSGTYSKSNYKEKLDLINRINTDKLKKIAKLAGRFKRLAMTTQSEKVKRGMAEAFSVIPGKDLKGLIPTERIRMSNKNRHVKRKFWLDWTEGKTLVYELISKEKKCLGPIVACIDNSGSMSGDEEVWAKAVALGLLEIATYQKRPMYVIQFSAQYRTENLKVHSFPKGRDYDITEVLEMAEYFEGGGTMFETPLQKAREIIDETTDFKKADIIFITDGEAPVGNDFLKDFLTWKREKKVQLFSILIDTGWSSESSLSEFSDRIERLSDLRKGASNDSVAIEVFKHL